MGNQITIRVFSNLPMSPHILDSIHSQDVIKICKHNPEQGARLPTNGGTVLSRPDQSWSSSCPHSWILTEPLQSHWPRIPLVRLRTRRYVTILRNWALSPQLVSQSELSVGGDWPIRAEHQEPACRDQYTEPPTASVLGGVYLKSAPVRNWKDTDILIEIRTRALLFSPPLPWLRLSFCVLRCRHVGHTFSLPSGAPSVGTKMNSDPRHERDSDIM